MDDKFLRSVSARIREHGSGFEDMIREKERENPSFAFLYDEKVNLAGLTLPRMETDVFLYSYRLTTTSRCCSTRGIGLLRPSALSTRFVRCALP